jgi:hypothetical protein
MEAENRGGQGPIWAVGPLDGWILYLAHKCKVCHVIKIRTMFPVKTCIYEDVKLGNLIFTS